MSNSEGKNTDIFSEFWVYIFMHDINSQLPFLFVIFVINIMCVCIYVCIIICDNVLLNCIIIMYIIIFYHIKVNILVIFLLKKHFCFLCS